MNNLSDYSGINLFIGNPETLRQIPEESKAYALIATTDEKGMIVGIGCYDPIQGYRSVLHKIPNLELLTTQASNLARQRNIDLNSEQCHMLHLQPELIAKMFPMLLGSDIKSEVEYAEEYFASNPSEAKFNRKSSGLSHSYTNDPDEGIFKSENKDECRVVWTRSLPDQRIFENLPTNTSGAYVVVQPENSRQAKLYYLRKSNHPETVPQLVSSAPKLRELREFQFNNRGLTKEELSDMPKTLHQPDTQNVFGSGNFARVKKASVAKGRKLHTKFASKIQKLKKGDRFGTKLGGRSEEIANLQKEARVLADLELGSGEVLIQGDKGYLHMLAKGTPLNVRAAHAPFAKKIDYSIQWFMRVGELHDGEASLSNTGYAHRDLKPANALVDDNDQITIVDYGLATTNLTTKTEQSAATLFYAPLDQVVIDHYASGVPRIAHTVTTDDETNSDSEKHTPQTFASESSDFSEDGDEIEQWGTEIALPTGGTEQIPDIRGSELPPEEYPANWTFCLGNPKLCITQNYLQDDKVAALRTVFNRSKIAEKGDSILNADDFASLPVPIQAVLDSDRIAPLISPERAQETEFFFAAILIYYQQNPDLSDREYQQKIQELRQDPLQQRDLVARYEDQHQLDQHKRKRVVTPYQLDDTSPSEKLMFKEKRMKPKPASFSEKKSFYQSLKDKIMRRPDSSSSIHSETSSSSTPSSGESSLDPDAMSADSPPKRPGSKNSG